MCAVIIMKYDLHLYLYTQSAEEDIEVVHLREQNAKLKKERESMVRRGMSSVMKQLFSHR